MFKFEELRVYQEALVFVELIYQLTKSWPKSEVFGLTNQVRRAAVSIALNLAEGSSRTKKDFSHFVALARGSIYECVAVLTIARKQGYITETQFIEAYTVCQKLARMATALKQSLL